MSERIVFKLYKPHEYFVGIHAAAHKNQNGGALSFLPNRGITHLFLLEIAPDR